MNNIKNNPGFTLIELLIVISIIGILALLAIANFSGAKTNAQFVKMTNDVSAGGIAVEQYKNQNELVPVVQNPFIPGVTNGSCNLWGFTPITPKTSGVNYYDDSLPLNNQQNNYITNALVPFSVVASQCSEVTGNFDSGFSKLLFTGLPQQLLAKITNVGRNDYEYDYITKDCLRTVQFNNGVLINSQYPDYIVMAQQKNGTAVGDHRALLWIYDGLFYTSNDYNKVQDMRLPGNYTPRVGEDVCFVKPS